MAVKPPDHYLQRAKEMKHLARERVGISGRTEWP